MRRLKLRILTLRDENSTLRDEIDLNNDTSTELAARCDDLGAQLEAKIELVRTQEKQLRKQEREFTSLKVLPPCLCDRHAVLLTRIRPNCTL